MSNDKTRCGNQSCAQKYQCGRFVAEAEKDRLTWYSDFKPNKMGVCWHQTPVEVPKSSYTK